MRSLCMLRLTSLAPGMLWRYVEKSHPVQHLCWKLVNCSCSASARHNQTLADTALQNPGVAKVVLKKGKAQLFRNGSPMVYTGAVDCVIGRPPPQSGDAVLVTDGAQQPIAWGVYNPVSMFCVRIMQTEGDAYREPGCVLDMEQLIKSRICIALDLRTQLGFPSDSTNVYRLVNSEGDRLSGLIVDVLGTRVIIASSAGWVEKYRNTIEKAIAGSTGISNITWRQSLSILAEDGLQLDEDAVSQSPPQTCEVLESGIRYRASTTGQKTGFYADQRDSRLLIRSLCKNKSVLDLCCYGGGFSLNAAYGGASDVTGVDSSMAAIELARDNLVINQMDPNSISFVKADIMKFLKSAISENKYWDVVILDPPKLAPNRKVLPRAAVKYRTLNALAMQATRKSGLLMTCSCSGAMTQSGMFLSVLQEAANSVGRSLTQLRHAGASSDHVVNPAYPEGSYLTNILLSVL